LDEVAFLEAVKDGVDGPLPGLKEAGGAGVEVLDELVAVAGAFAEDGEEEGFHVAVEGFLGEFHGRGLMVYSFMV
jgi:hypothetical protein